MGSLKLGYSVLIDKAAEVVHKVKHYGAFGEEYLGYSDPTKDLRKAVKQKEKAAKKAKKANKKRTGKKEDLFDPENLAKYKRDIEQRRLEQEAVQAQAADPESEDEDKAGSDKDPENQKLKFTLDLAPESPQDLSNAATPVRSPFRYSLSLFSLSLSLSFFFAPLSLSSSGCDCFFWK